MAHSSRTKRRRLTLIGSAVAILALSLSMAPGAAVAGQKHSPSGPSHAAAHARTVDVMSRNLYLGADLFPVIGALATSPAAVPGAASLVWGKVQATKPEERMAAIADEIAKARPAVVGLQEVTTWTTYSATGVPTVQYDFLELLLKALADRGVVYHEVEGATAHNFTSPAIPLAAGSGAAAVSLADRDVIIKRDGVKTWNAQSGTFTNILRFPLADGTVLPVARGWGSVDVRTKLATFRFVNSHLEAFGIEGIDAEALRVLQVKELLAAQAAITAAHGDIPTVYVGDYNSAAPQAPAYQLLVGAVGSDAWIDTNPTSTGNTCCFDDEVKDPYDPLTSRIDLVVIDENVTAKSAYLVGEERTDMTVSGLWPSDHAGVVATLRIGHPGTWRPGSRR